MLIDDFKNNYTTIPFATYTRNHRKSTQSCHLDTLCHMHKEMEILLVLEGSAQLHSNAQSYDIAAGDILFIAPYTLHRYTIFADRDFKHHCICFDLALLHDTLLKTGLENGTVTIPQVISAGETYAGFIIAAVNADAQKAPGWEFQVVGNLSFLFGAIKANGHISDADHPAEQSIYFQIADYIENHFSEDITSADLANMLHINNSYFCRLFRKNFGLCFQHHLCMYRIEKSKFFLKYTDMSISEIALRVGFNSFSYYSKCFKAYTSLSPTVYRAQR